MARLVIVLGPFRSGTSLTAALCSALGVDFGPESDFTPGADRYNPTGYFQRRSVVAANQGLLGPGECDLYRGQPLSPGDGDSPSKSVAEVGYDWARPGRARGLKDPRFCITLPLWESEWARRQFDLQLVRVTRDHGAAAASCARHRFVGEYCDYSEEKARRLVESMDRAAAALCDGSSRATFTIAYEALVEDPPHACAELAAFLSASGEAGELASRLVGKRNALQKHYFRKLGRPGEVLSGLRKTLQRINGR